MLGQGKNIWQAEIDAAVETIDFWRFAAKFAAQVHEIQPTEHPAGVWNRMEHRPLEGFVAAITPFNFIAIAANLPSSPAIMGNVALWKPAHNTVLASKLLLDIMHEAGLPEGVIQFLPGDGPIFAEGVMSSPHMAGMHFTGSTKVFDLIHATVAKNIETYKSYPRVVGETGGKNFHYVHPSAAPDLEHIVHNTIRGAFEYQGQKCSATSRLYIPKSLWGSDGVAGGGPFAKRLLEELARVKVGDPDDFSSFMTAVINRRAFDRIQGYISRAKASPECEILFGGECDDSTGFFIQPTVIATANPNYETLTEEIFGPVLTVHPYDDATTTPAEICALIDATSPYALTGAVFARDRRAIASALAALRNAAGNFYVNDKSTGSMVGQQPFGGARRSGTNDKSGSAANLMRWVSARSIKENFVPLKSWRYPHME